MARFCAQFGPGEPGRICFLGLGNTDYGDDGFGVRLAGELKKAGMQDVVIAGSAPEQCLGRIAAQEFDALVFLDAVDFGAAPGSLVVLGAQEIQERFPQISTHKISLAVLTKLVQSNGRTRAWLLGVQPESIRPGTTLTPRVQATLEIVTELLLESDSCNAILEPVEPGWKMKEHVC